MQFQREHERVDVEGRVRAMLCHGGDEPAIEVVNISRSGAALVAHEPIGSVPDRAELRMRADDDADWVSFPCELRYILGENRPDGQPSWLHGVRFTEVTDPVSEFLDRLIATATAA